MKLDQLPLELLTQIAGYLSLQDAEEFSSTCQNCYYAMLPHMWHHLSLHNTTELIQVADRLKKNEIWAQRAIQYVRDVSLTHESKGHYSNYSPTVSALMFGIAALPSDQALEQSENKLSTRQEHIGRFGRRLLKLFPYLSNLVLDFREATRDFRPDTNEPKSTSTDTTTSDIIPVPPELTRISSVDSEDDDKIPDDARLPYSGSISLIGYKSDNTRFMHYLLLPFRETHHLKVQASPIISLCDDIDESILTDDDIADLATIGLNNLRKLELSYLDSNVSLDTLKNLIQSLPSIKELELEWVFPPSKQEFENLCKEFQNCGSLHADQVCTTERNILHARFTKPILNH